MSLFSLNILFLNYLFTYLLELSESSSAIFE